MKNISEVKFQETPRIFRTEVPNIVFELLEAQEISTSDFILYSVYRRIAGEQGACWVGTRGLSEKTGLSTPTITKSKINLSRPFAALNGKSLIEITPCDHEKQIADTVTINDIWIDNHEHFKNKLTCVKRRYGGVQKEDTGVCKNKLQKKEQLRKNHKEVVCVAAPPVAAPPRFHQIILKDNKGENLTLTKQLLFEECIRLRKDWTEPEIDELWEILVKYPKPVIDWLKFCDGTIKNKRKMKRIKEFNIKDKECKSLNSKKEKPLKTQPVTGALKTLERATNKHLLENWRSILGR